MQDDKTIIEAILNDDKNQFRFLVQKYQDNLYGLCLKMLGDKDKAQDILQESFIDIYKHLASFKYNSQFSTWAYTITYRNIAKTFKVKRKNLLLEQMQFLPEVEDEPDSSNLKVELLESALKILNETERAIVFMFYYQGFSITEIAHVMTQSEGNVKIILHRCRKKLKNELEPVFKTIE